MSLNIWTKKLFCRTLNLVTLRHGLNRANLIISIYFLNIASALFVEAIIWLILCWFFDTLRHTVTYLLTDLPSFLPT